MIKGIRKAFWYLSSIFQWFQRANAFFFFSLFIFFLLAFFNTGGRSVILKGIPEENCCKHYSYIALRCFNFYEVKWNKSSSFRPKEIFTWYESKVSAKKKQLQFNNSITIQRKGEPKVECITLRSNQSLDKMHSTSLSNSLTHNTNQYNNDKEDLM